MVDAQGTGPETSTSAFQEPMVVVGLGASAGGLEALEAFFERMPIDSGAAFVVIQHLSPDHKSLMVELLTRFTRMEVVRATNDMRLEANRIYLIQPRQNMTLRGNHLVLSAQTPQPGPQLPIDIFFHSLAENYGDRCIGIVLSGTGSDGMRGIRSIKESGGLVLVQEENQAKFDGMPRSAISTGMVDLILPVEQMPAEITRYIRSADAREVTTSLPKPEVEHFDRIMELLRQQTNVDFTFYKSGTLLRRLDRRMTSQGSRDLTEYIQILERSPAERSALYKELLIGVTRFFRDPDAFDILQRELIPKICDRSNASEPIRVWVAGCSTGEEAYSIAMLFRSYLDEHQLNHEVKIFATDIDRDAVEFAGAGIYPEHSVQEVPESFRTRFFQLKRDQYQVQRTIREMIIFAYQNIIKDPPMTRMDLVSCRNLLIYLQPVLQKKVLALLAYALRADGFLFLGPSESVGSISNQFEPIDLRWKIFRHLGGNRQTLQTLLSGPLPRSTEASVYPMRSPRSLNLDDQLYERIHQELMDSLGLRCLVIDADFRLMHSFGSIQEYLRMQPGRATLDVTKLCLPELSTPLRACLLATLRDHEESTFDRVQIASLNRTIRLRVRPIPNPNTRTLLMLAIIQPEEHSNREPQSIPTSSSSQLSRIETLEQELQYNKETLQATIEELETSNEELQTTNEELISSNEELQSTNEELQSVNEELQTVNSEYQQKIQQLTELNNDISNLLRVSQIGIVFVDDQLRIRNYTPAVDRIIHILPQDLHRPLQHISTVSRDLNLVEAAKKVLITGQSVTDLEVQLHDGSWFFIHCLPYLDESDRCRGVVIHTKDVTEVKRQQTHLQSIIDSLPAHIAVLSPEGKITLVNEAWQKFAKQNGDQDGLHTGIGKNYLDVCQMNQEDGNLASEARRGIEEVLQGKTDEFSMEYPCHSPDSQRWFLLRASPLKGHQGGAVVWHLDITKRVLAEARNSEPPMK